MSAQFLKQSTAATLVLGPFVDSTDGVTAETGLALAQADIRLSKNGAAFAQKTEAAAATHMENGYYSTPIDTTDTGTLGRLTVAVAEAGALPVRAEFIVLPANVYDALVLGTDKLQVDSVEVSSDTTTADNLQTAFQSTLAEETAVPAANAPWWTKLNFLFAKGRNKMTQTATVQKLRNDADNADIAASTLSDDGTTFTRGEFA